MKVKFINMALAGVLCLTLSACFGEDKQSEAPARQAPIARVSTITLEPLAVVLYSDMPGRTLAYEKAEVRPEVTGIILERAYQEGASVNKGQSLYLIDPDLYQAAYDSAKASLERTKAALNVASLKERRTAELRKKNSVSQQDYDETRAAYLQARAEVEAASAAEQSAKINLDRTVIQAPISGLTGTSTVSVGTLVANSQASPLTTIYQIDPMNVDLTQSVQELTSISHISSQLDNEKDYKKFTDLSAPVILILNDGSQYEHIGELKFVDVGVDSNTATMTLRAEFPNPDYKLLPGLFVRAKLQIGIDKNALLIPQKAVLRDNKGAPYVFIADGYDGIAEPKEGQDAPKAKAVRRFITLGASYDGNWLVTDGIKAGESVVLEGLQNVTEQADIAIVKRSMLDIPEDAEYLTKNSAFTSFGTEVEPAKNTSPSAKSSNVEEVQ